MQLSLANKIAFAALRNCYGMINITKTNHQQIVTNHTCLLFSGRFLQRSIQCMRTSDLRCCYVGELLLFLYSMRSFGEDDFMG
jgi:hypothetical protein